MSLGQRGVVAAGPAGALAGHLQEIAGATHDLAGGVLVSWNDGWRSTLEPADDDHPSAGQVLR